MTRFQLRRDILANWTSSNPILLQGEPVFELDTFKFKIGDGLQNYNDLPYIGDHSGSGVGTPGGINYSIQFKDPDGTFGGSSNFTFNNSTGRFAINVNSPSSTFHLRSSIPEAFRLEGQATIKPKIQFASVNEGVLGEIRSYADYLSFGGTTDATSIRVSDDGDTLVGSGPTIPFGYKFQVYDDVAGNFLTQIQNENAGGDGLWILSAAGASSRNALRAGGNASDIATFIKGDGRIGIKVLAPTEDLDVLGQIRLRGGSPSTGRVLTSDVDGVGSWQEPQTNDSSGANGRVQLSDGSNGFTHNENLQYDAANGLSIGSTGFIALTLSKSARISNSGSAFMELTETGLGLTTTLQTNDTDGGELVMPNASNQIAIKLSAGGNSYFENNIGIGTTVPTQKLDVNGQIRIRGGSPGAGKVLTSDASGNATWQTASSGGTPAGSTGYIQYNSSGSFGGESALFWNSNNNRLGINTTVPYASLDVNGQIRIQGGNPGADKILVSDVNGVASWESTIRTYEVEIGPWDMTSRTQIAVKLPNVSDVRKIRCIEVLIQEDRPSNPQIYLLNNKFWNDDNAGIGFIQETGGSIYVYLFNSLTSWFATIHNFGVRSFNNTTINRGWVTYCVSPRTQIYI
jgi:hypothetical protein